MKIAYLHLVNLDEHYSEQNDGSYSFLDKEIGIGKGNFKWLDENHVNWFANNFKSPDLLCFNGKYYKYSGYDKHTLKELELINKPVTTTNEQPICECCLTNKATGMHIPGYSAEGFCSNCWDCIKDLE
jgi:hypothetical protein